MKLAVVVVVVRMKAVVAERARAAALDSFTAMPRTERAESACGSTYSGQCLIFYGHKVRSIYPCLWVRL